MTISDDAVVTPDTMTHNEYIRELLRGCDIHTETMQRQCNTKAFKITCRRELVVSFTDYSTSCSHSVAPTNAASMMQITNN